jgi:hypothetical protein
LKPTQANSLRNPNSKTPNTHIKKGGGGVAQMIERLPSKHEILSSNSTTTGKKKKKEPYPAHSTILKFELTVCLLFENDTETYMIQVHEVFSLKEK